MATVIVQSDSLAAWTGLAGALAGVVLAAGIDWWRARRAERKQTRRDLLRAGRELATTATVYGRANRTAGKAKDEPAWREILDARSTAMVAAIWNIDIVGVAELNTAAKAIIDVALKPTPGDEAEADRRSDEMRGAVLAFGDAVQKAKL
jgi:hypothetical protein